MAEKKNYKYKFSVVIPVYGVEKYLEETILSVVEQDIGFKKNIQIILINDGSPDNSEAICLKYRDKYPDNIIYVKQENSGVSSARNNGMQYVEGKYVNFLDSDDKWSKNAFSEVYRFFEKKYDLIDLVACPQRFFEATDEYHWLYFKFTKDRVVDILEKFTFVQLHITASILKAEVLKDHKFDEQLKYAEDTKFVNEVIMEKLRYGLVCGAMHYYRKRLDESSAVQNKAHSKAWIFVTPKHHYLELIQKSLRLYGTVIPYIQYLIMYDLQWRFREQLTDVLTKEQLEEYRAILREILQYMDDDIICKPKKMYIEQKIYALSLKYGEDIREKLHYKQFAVWFNNIRIFRFSSKALFSVDILNVKDGMLCLEGQVWSAFTGDLEFFITDETGKMYPVELTPSEFRKAVCLGDTVIQSYTYCMKLPMENGRRYRVQALYRGLYWQEIFIRYKKFAKITHDLKYSYCHLEDYLIGQGEKEIFLYKKSFLRHVGYELRYLGEVIANGKIGLFAYRMLYHLLKRFKRKEIWLVMERINVAGDNAEHFYKYLRKHQDENVKSWFVISKNSPDYEKMKKIGPVLPYRSVSHKIKSLLADKIISSQGEDNIVNQFDDDKMFMADLFKFKYAFLQHGIIKDDLSEWLHKFNKNLDMFVTSAKPEYQSVLDCDYDYDESVVKLTGLPRYDNLYQRQAPEKSILLLPTWRYSLALTMDNVTGERIYNPRFKYSSFFKFYQSLIQDERLIACLKKHGYTGKFYLHPHHHGQLKDFTDNDCIRIIKGTIDYQKEFVENALLVTDFSSVAFDFAYLKKPVIYAQFDLDTFYEGQVYQKGYFEYERDGLGPVVYDYESTVNKIIEAVENGCQLEPKYEERIENFYYRFDRDNCKRVLEEVKKL